jgi:hypothetical protein
VIALDLPAVKQVALMEALADHVWKASSGASLRWAHCVFEACLLEALDGVAVSIPEHVVRGVLQAKGIRFDAHENDVRVFAGLKWAQGMTLKINDYGRALNVPLELKQAARRIVWGEAVPAHVEAKA